MTKNIFVTGGTGFLGRNWLPQIRVRPSNPQIYLLMRKKRTFQDHKTISVIGDVTEEGIIRDTKRLLQLQNNITHIYHTVSSTSFSELERYEIFNLNVKGTKNIINFARKCSNLEQLIYISTAYVENRRENEFVPEYLPIVTHENLKSGNPYEESKIAAELLIRNSCLPWTIIRPAIFSGDSKTGFTGYDNRMGYGVLLGVLKSAFNSTANDYFRLREDLERKEDLIEVPCRLKGFPDTRKNFMFIDDIVGQLEAIACSTNTINKTYHVISRHSITCKQMLDAIQRSLRITGFYFAGDLHENDIKLSDKDYQNTRRAALLVSKIYSPYFLRQEPIWGTENIDMCLNNHKYDRIDMSVEKFNWLMNQYVENELKTVLSRK